MTPAEQQLIRTSWAALEPVADHAAELFYARLFQLDPRLKAHFGDSDMARQRMLLMQTLTVVVRNIDRLHQILPEVEALGRRHVGYGVTADHYATVGSALVWTIEQGLGTQVHGRDRLRVGRCLPPRVVRDDRGRAPGGNTLSATDTAAVASTGSVAARPGHGIRVDVLSRGCPRLWTDSRMRA